MYVLLLIMLIPIYVSMMFIPYWTRRTESFGVSIPEAIYYTPKLQTMRKQHVLQVGLVSLCLSILFLFLNMRIHYDENIWAIFFTVGIILYLIACFIIYLRFHQKMKQLKASERWDQEKSQLVVINTTFRDQKRTYSNRWFIISFVIACLTSIITFKFYHHIPERIPMQYNFSGEVTNWATKSYRSAMMLPIMQLYMTFLFLFINTMIAKAKQQIDASDPDTSLRKNIIFRKRWSLFMIVNGTAFVLLFGFIQLSFIIFIDQQILLTVSLVLTFLLIIWSIILSITTGQGGSRVRIGKSFDGEAINRDDDHYWKLGQFYFNKEDPSLFIEKRFGIGWTNNWARPLSWIILLSIIGLAVGIPILLS